MHQRIKQLLKFAAKLVVTAALLYWVFKQIDFNHLGTVFKTARWGFLWGVWILAIVVYWGYAVKMHLILKKLDCPADIHTLFAVSMIVALYSMILPGMVDTSIKWYMLKQHTGKGSIIFTSMVYNQFTVMVVIVITSLAALMFVNPGGNWLLPVVCLAVITVIALLCILLLNKTTSSFVADAFRFLLRPFPRAIRDIVSKIIKELSTFRTVSPSFHLVQLALVFAVSTIVGSIIYLFAAKAAQIDVPFGILICQCAVISIIGRLPISIADLGIREATIVGSLSLYGVDASSALLMSLIIFSHKILLAAIGSVYMLYWNLSRTNVGY